MTRTKNLIDVDDLDRLMYQKSFETDDGRQKWDSGLWIRYKIYEEAREEVPRVDAVPGIRCKDCKHFKHDADCFGDCTLDGGMQRTVYTTDYCSLAERKEDHD